MKRKSTFFEPRTPLKWKTQDSVLMTEYGNPSITCKIAAFDLDGTLITTKSGKTYAKDASDWAFWNAIVPHKLHDLVTQGYLIVIFSNQLGLSLKPQRLSPFKEKIGFFLNSMKVPLLFYAALKDDHYRKPRLGLWALLKERLKETTESFYIGDAAGRSLDHSDTDFKFALNAGLTFKTPEMFFLDKQETMPTFSFDPFQYASKKPLKHSYASDRLELVLLVGSPASGKTRFAHCYFLPHGYVHINQDTLKEKCLKACQEALSNQQSCIIDNTNPDPATRGEYVKIASMFNVPIVCYVMSASMELCQHNDHVRSIIHGQSRLPKVAMASFKQRLVPPQAKEGFEAIHTIDFIPDFQNEEEKKQWFMYYY
jgi:bifunctional polynucleotide phosphatase/kinase